MSERLLVASELAKLFSVLSHPDRIRIIEELHGNPQDVQSLSSLLEISSSRVSQHLKNLRLLRLVQECREGKRHIYSLVDSEVAGWVLNGLKFTEMELIDSKGFDKAVKKAMRKWDSN